MALGVAAATISSLTAMPAQAPEAPPPQGVDRIIITDTASKVFAVPSCIPRAGDEATQAACRTISEVLRKDLDFEKLFKFVPDSLLSAIPAMNPDAPNFEDWRGIGANVLVVTRAEAGKGGELSVEVKAYAVESRQVMIAKKYSGRLDSPRALAHSASDDIVALTQYRGVARTRIAFISDRDATAERRAKELYIVDYDGFNPRRVTVNGSLNLLPNWSPDGRSLAYVSYRQGSPLIYLASIFEGKSTANLTAEPAGKQAFAPAISPDGKRIAWSSDRGGNTDIYVANIDGSGVRRLTSTPSSETAPAWSPTGQEIAFTSGRTGTPQIYLMDAEGLNVRRLTTVGNWNDAPTWNPSKQYSEIAYTARLEAGGFDIAVIDLASRQVRQVTEGRGSCEYPSWAPNGRSLVFSCKRGNTWQVTVSDREGRFVQSLSTGPGNNVQPDWGPIPAP